MDKKESRLKQIVHMGIDLAIVAGLLLFSIEKLGYRFVWGDLWAYRVKFFNGFVMTILISLFAMVVSVCIGTVTTIFVRSGIPAFRYWAKGYVGLIRGTPFLVQIYFLYYIIATAFGVSNRILLGIIILSIFSGAYVAEIIRGGLESISPSQHVTAKAIGLTVWQKYRFVIIPQVIKRILPALTGQMTSLVKDSSLLSVIAVGEFAMNVLEVDSINFRTFENLTFMAIGYLMITIPVSLASKKLERKFAYET